MAFPTCVDCKTLAQPSLNPAPGVGVQRLRMQTKRMVSWSRRTISRAGVHFQRSPVISDEARCAERGARFPPPGRRRGAGHVLRQHVSAAAHGAEAPQSAHREPRGGCWEAVPVAPSAADCACWAFSGLESRTKSNIHSCSALRGRSKRHCRPTLPDGKRSFRRS